MCTLFKIYIIKNYSQFILSFEHCNILNKTTNLQNIQIISQWNANIFYEILNNKYCQDYINELTKI